MHLNKREKLFQTLQSHLRSRIFYLMRLTRSRKGCAASRTYYTVFRLRVCGVKIAPAFNLNVLQKKKVDQKAIAQMYYDMYAIAASLAVEDIKIKAQQMVDELTEDLKYHPENYENNCNNN